MADKPKTDDKPKTEDKPAGPPIALCSKFTSHEKPYTVLRMPRVIGDTLTSGQQYEVTVGARGVMTLTPAGIKGA